MNARHEEIHRQKKEEMMVNCFECYAEHGLNGAGIKLLAKACGCTSGNLYSYFDNLDELIVSATEFCMSKVEDDFIAKAPTDLEGVMRFIDEIPYWTAKEHGKKYRLMYQIYTNPKYIEEGRKFFEGVNKRYTEYAKKLEGSIGIPCDILTPLIFMLIRASVHYALFEDEFYLKSQTNLLKECINLYIKNNQNKA